MHMRAFPPLIINADSVLKKNDEKQTQINASNWRVYVMYWPWTESV